MSPDPEFEAVVEARCRVLQTLADTHRVRILINLVNTPEERRLPLPKAAMIPKGTDEPEQLSIELQHVHLPAMADAGYVRWSKEPFCVQRGPRFEEPATIVRILVDSLEELPPSLWNEAVAQFVEVEP